MATKAIATTAIMAAVVELNVSSCFGVAEGAGAFAVTALV